MLVRLSEKKIVFVGACAKGETCCVQMNVNVEEQGMRAFKVEYIHFFCY